MDISADEVTSLKNKADELKDVMGKPLQVKARRKIATQNLNELEKEANWKINNRLKPMVISVFEKENEEMVRKFLEISSPDKDPMRKFAVMGLISDQENQEPILNAVISIEGTEISYRVRSKKGQFRIKNLEPGTYTMVVTHEKYVEKRVEFTHAWGETTRLSIEMERTAVGQPEEEVEAVE